jgi:hypothetical protein
MTTETEVFQIDTELTLYDPLKSPVTVSAVNLTLTKKYDEIIECRLAFKIDFQLYQYIDTKALFNLEPNIRVSGNDSNFQESFPIQIEVSLKPDLLSNLQKHATNANEAMAHLLSQCQQQKFGEPATQTEELSNHSSNHSKSLDPLLATESWLALSVKQSQKSIEVGYCTLWSHASLLGLSMVDSSQEKISESINTLFQDLGIGDLGFGDITKEITAESMGAITHLLRNLDEETSEKTTQSTTSTPPIKNKKTTLQDISSQSSIFEATVNFFKKDDWHYVQLNGQSVLRLAFEGKNGKYDCYAQTREKQQQFIFYSICPIKIPKSKRRAVGEFLSRANYGMIIGNFEINFNDGEIRYKTSNNVKKYSLEADTIRQLVYTNVKIIDEYFPGVIAVAKGRMSPEDAITKIENQAN